MSEAKRQLGQIKPGDIVLTAYAEPAAGPGWSNSPIWVIVMDPTTGQIRRECFQVDEYSANIALLYKISSAVHYEMTSAVERLRQL